MQRYLFLMLFSMQFTVIQAQTFSVKGVVTTSENQGLPAATILLLHATDSTMVNYGITNTEGWFDIQEIPTGSYFLRVTYVGYATLMIPLESSEEEVLDLGEIRMYDEQTVLEEFILQEQRIPMRVRGDTIEYDALAFKVQPNEVVEDLLRRMPGIDIQHDGSIMAQGERVRRMLVDGREFFGRDPKMATKNLPADAISKVHVFNEKSEQSKFSGIDDGQRERTINLELKEDRKGGMFGNTSLGYGPDNRYLGKTNLNRFDNKGQYSLLGMTNNLNQQGFSAGDYVNFSGGMKRLSSGRGGLQINANNASGVPLSLDGQAGAGGLTTSWAGGLNMSRTLFDNTDVTASYFYNRMDQDVKRDTERENFLPEGNYDFRQYNRQNNQNNNQSVNLRADHKINEKNSLLFTANASVNDSQSEQQSSSSTSSASGQTQNSSEQNRFVLSRKVNLTSALLWRKRFSLPGRTLTSEVDFSLNHNEQKGSLEAMNRFFGDMLTEQSLHQNNYQDNYHQNLAANMAYTEPLGSNAALEASYLVARNKSETEQEVFDIESGLEMWNAELSKAYKNVNLYQRLALSYSLKRDNWNMTLGSGLQLTSLSGTLVHLQQELSKDYLNILPSLRLNYEINSFRRLFFEYETSIREPGIQQLQPLVDNSDPLNLYAGNPDLRPAYIHRLDIRWNSFNPLNFLGFFVFLSSDYTKNAIANAINVDERLVRTIMPVNAGSTFSVRGNLNMNIRFSAIQSRVTMGATISHRQSTDILNAAEQRIFNNTLNGSLKYNFRPSDAFETSLSASVNQQLTAYRFSSLEQAFLNQTYTASLFWRFLSDYLLNIEMQYQSFKGRSNEFDRNIPMLDAGFSRRFLKGDIGELKLTVHNLLNEDLGVNQSMSANYNEKQLTNSLGRYFLLTFTYSLNHSLKASDNGK